MFTTLLQTLQPLYILGCDFCSSVSADIVLRFCVSSAMTEKKKEKKRSLSLMLSNLIFWDKVSPVT